MTVEKVAKPLFRMGKHEIFTSISGEIVGKNFARGVISDAHVIGNDVIELYSVACGRRNSLQEGFIYSLSAPPEKRRAFCRLYAHAALDGRKAVGYDVERI